MKRTIGQLAILAAAATLWSGTAQAVWLNSPDNKPKANVVQGTGTLYGNGFVGRSSKGLYNKLYVDYDFSGSDPAKTYGFLVLTQSEAGPGGPMGLGTYQSRIDFSKPASVKGRVEVDASPYREGEGFLRYLVETDAPSSNFRVSLHSVGAVPEPATWAMMIVGFGAVGLVMRRKRRPAPIAAFAPA